MMRTLPPTLMFLVFTILLFFCTSFLRLESSFDSFFWGPLWSRLTRFSSYLISTSWNLNSLSYCLATASSSLKVSRWLSDYCSCNIRLSFYLRAGSYFSLMEYFSSIFSNWYLFFCFARNSILLFLSDASSSSSSILSFLTWSWEVSSLFSTSLFDHFSCSIFSSLILCKSSWLMISFSNSFAYLYISSNLVLGTVSPSFKIWSSESRHSIAESLWSSWTWSSVILLFKDSTLSSERLKHIFTCRLRKFAR